MTLLYVYIQLQSIDEDQGRGSRIIREDARSQERTSLSVALLNSCNS